MKMEMGLIIAAATLAIALASSIMGGAWWMSKLDSRVAAIEQDQVWKAAVNHRLNTNDKRWAKHFNLWGDNIRDREAELNDRRSTQ